MNNITIFCILLYYIATCTQDVFCKSLEEVQENNDNDDKIVGGSDADIRTYPYQAYLMLTDGTDFFECGGSIVSRTSIVTAAHCLTGMQSIQVRIGSTNKFSGGLTYNTSTFYQHPMFDPGTFEYDAAVVKISEGMELDGENATTIGLVGFFNDPAEGENVNITGWGVTAQNGPTTDTLKAAEVTVFNRTYCTSQIASVTPRKFCAGRPEGGVDTCQGDSGGPAVINMTLTGITSFGIGCAQEGYPGVYARIGDMMIRSFIWLYTGA